MSITIRIPIFKLRKILHFFADKDKVSDGRGTTDVSIFYINEMNINYTKQKHHACRINTNYFACSVSVFNFTNVCRMQILMVFLY